MKKTEDPKKKKTAAGLPLVRSNAAGIDIGDTFHAVAVPEGRDEVQVRAFGSMTCDLLSIAEWLKQCGVDTVAMEAPVCTGNRSLVCSSKKALRCIW